MALMKAALLLVGLAVLCCDAYLIPEFQQEPQQPPAEETPAEKPEKPAEEPVAGPPGPPWSPEPIVKPLPVTAGSCPKNMRRVDCPLNPCLLVSCPAVKIAQCVVDTCGRCRPRWIYVGREVTNDCLESLIACPDGSVHHKCPEDPCRTASCPAVDGAVCLADYCGGCKGRWILGDIEVTKKCHQGLASVASLIPGRCMGRRCQAPIPAMCIDHGNLHEWRDWNHNDVTHICENSLLASLENFWCSPPTCHVPEARCDLLDGRPVWQFPPGREVTNWCY